MTVSTETPEETPEEIRARASEILQDLAIEKTPLQLPDFEGMTPAEIREAYQKIFTWRNTNE